MNEQTNRSDEKILPQNKTCPQPLHRWQTKFLVLCLSILVTLLAGGCTIGNSSSIDKVSELPTTQPNKQQWRIGFVQAKGGIKEQLLNQSVEATLKKAKESLEVSSLALQQGELSNDREAMDYLVNNGYQLIIGIGSNQVNALTQCAKEYPDVTFVIIDDIVELPNVVSVNFREEESAFLAGTLAALITKSNIVGYIGGANIPPNIYESAFKAGVDYINQTDKRQQPVQVKANYAGYFAKDFENPGKGEALAIADIESGADLLFHTAGRTGDGVLAAAASRGVKVIGSGYNQSTLFPGTVLTSTVKIADQGLYQVIQDIAKGQLKPGQRFLGLKERAVGLTDLKAITPEETIAFKNNTPGLTSIKVMKEAIPQEVVDRLNLIRTQLIEGKLMITLKPTQ